MSKLKLLATGTDAKTVKGESSGWLTFIMYLAPTTVSVPHGGRNVCPFASPGCSAACLYTAGHGRLQSVQNARIRKTVEYFQNRDGFLAELRSDIAVAEKMAAARKMNPCFRLNGTSDINWGRLIADYPHLIFYDYTASSARVIENDVSNYHLTFSRKETTPDDEVDRVLSAGHNVAVVFSKPGVVEYRGHKVIDGDLNDLRFIDPKGVIVGLKAKGDAKKDTSGFAVQV